MRLMIVRGLAAAALAVCAAVSASPVHGAEPPLDVALAAGWDGVQDAGWVPYVVTLANRGDADFRGTVRLVPERRNAGVSLPWQPPAYESRLTIPRHATGQRVVFYVRGERYLAEVADSAGRTVRRARLTPRPAAPLVPAPVTVGLLTGGDAAEAQVRALAELAPVAVYRFVHPAELPANPVVLGNLAVVVIAGADSAALTAGQVEALRRYVELGGTLAVTSGGAWRRTLAPLPLALTPLRPAGDEEVPLQALAALAGRTTGAAAAVATGALVAGRAVLDAPDGTPLVVESALGAGHVVELAYDPDEVAAADPALAQVGWGQAVFRAYGSLGLFGQGPDQHLPSTFGYAGPVDATWMLPLLEDLGAVLPAPSPALLGLLLLGPPLLLSIVAVALGLARRPPSRFWAVPVALALCVSPALWLGGTLLGTGTLVDSEVQLLRPAGEGRVLSLSSHAIVASAPGDYRLQLLPGALVGRLDYSIRPLGPPQLPDAVWQVVPPQVLAAIGGNRAGGEVLVEGLEAPAVVLLGVGTGPVLTMETASLHALDMTLEAHLRLRAGRVEGTVANLGARAVRGLRLYGGSATPGRAERAVLRVDLPPGSTATVDAPLETYVPTAVQPMAGGPVLAAATAAGQVMELAAARVVQRPGSFVLAGSTDPLAEAGPGSSRLRLRGSAVLVTPVALAGPTGAPGQPAPARPVSLRGDQDGMVDVYDLEVPSGGSSGPALDYTAAGGGLAPASIEVYDWASGGWRLLAVAAGPARVPLAATEVRGGLVRVRVHEATALGAGWDLRAAA